MLLFDGAIWLVKDLEPRLTRLNSDFQLCFSLFGWILKIQWKYQWSTWKKLVYDSPLQAKQNLKTCRKIYRRVSWHTQGFERLHCFVSLCNEFLSCYKISELGVTRWPSHLYVQRSVLPQERPRILSTQGSGEKLFCKMWKQGESSWSARCVNSWMLISCFPLDNELT